MTAVAEPAPPATLTAEQLLAAGMPLVRRMASLAHRRLGIEYEDACQEFALEVLKRAAAFDPSLGSVNHFVRLQCRSAFVQIARARANRSREYILNRAAHDQPDVLAADHRHDDPADRCERAEAVARVLAALATLTPWQRDVVTYRFGLGDAEHLTTEEVAARFGRTESGVKGTLAQSVRRLAWMLGADPRKVQVRGLVRSNSPGDDRAEDIE